MILESAAETRDPNLKAMTQLAMYLPTPSPDQSVWKVIEAHFSTIFVTFFVILGLELFKFVNLEKPVEALDKRNDKASQVIGSEKGEG